MQEKKRCAIYARVSTDKQEDSVENQVDQAKEFISRLGESFVADDDLVFIDDAVSGYYTSVFERSAMQRAIKAAKNGEFNVIIFKEIARVGRDKQENPAIAGMFEQYGIRVIAINDNYDSYNSDNVTFDILSVLAEQESVKTSTRVSSARRQKARRGQWGSEAPIGYKVDGETKKLIIDEELRHVPEMIFDMYVNGGLGTFKIAERLNRQGVLTKNNNLWSANTVRTIIKNQAYIGNVVHGMRKNTLKREYDETGKMTKKKVQVWTEPSEWVITENAHPAIIDKMDFYEAQRVLNSRGGHQSARRAYHPLTGILHCGKCGEGMIAQKRTHKDKEYRYYICKTYQKLGRDYCQQANVNADKLEQYIIDIIKNKLKALTENELIATMDKNEDISRLEQERKRIIEERNKKEKDQIDIFNQRHLFNAETYKEQMLNIKKQVDMLLEELDLIENRIAAIKEQADETANISKIIDGFLNMDIKDIATLRKLLHDLIKKVTLTHSHVEIEYNYNFS